MISSAAGLWIDRQRDRQIADSATGCWLSLGYSQFKMKLESESAFVPFCSLAITPDTVTPELTGQTSYSFVKFCPHNFSTTYILKNDIQVNILLKCKHKDKARYNCLNGKLISYKYINKTEPFPDLNLYLLQPWRVWVTGFKTSW